MRARAGRPTLARSKRARIEPRIKVWLERDGLVVLGGFRARLLRHVAETGSLAEAAGREGMSYRRAWEKVREIERNLGVPLVKSESGGYGGGGGSSLTPDGERLLARYERFRKKVEREVAKDFKEVIDR